MHMQHPQIHYMALLTLSCFPAMTVTMALLIPFSNESLHYKCSTVWHVAAAVQAILCMTVLTKPLVVVPQQM